MRNVFTLSILFLLPLTFVVFSLFIEQQAYTENAEPLWSNGTSMPTPRTEVSTAIIADEIYAIGGLDKTGKVLDTVEVYNIKNNSWKKVASLPEPLHHTAAAVSSINDQIYVVGGSSSTIEDWIPSDRLFIYDPLLDKWIEGKTMPNARGSAIANFINDTLFVIGGYGSSEILDVNEAYNTTSREWTTMAPIPTPRHHAASTVIDEKLYVIGGRTVGLYPIVNTNITERFDPQKNEWITLESMPSKRSGIGAVSVNDTIYVFGGENLTNTFNNNEGFNVKNNTWNVEKPMPTARHGLGVASFDGKIYVIGGGPASGLSVTNVNEIFTVR